MRINQWSDLIGKTLSGTTSVGWALYTKDERLSFKVDKVSSARGSIFSVNFFFTDTTFNLIKPYKYEHLSGTCIGEHIVPRRGTLINRMRYRHNALLSIKLGAINVTHINNTKIEHLFGPDLREWPLKALALRFTKSMLEASDTDRPLRDKVFDAQSDKASFLKTLELCRTVKEQDKPEPPHTEKVLVRLFEM